MGWTFSFFDIVNGKIVCGRGKTPYAHPDPVVSIGDLAVETLRDAEWAINEWAINRTVKRLNKVLVKADKDGLKLTKKAKDNIPRKLIIAFHPEGARIAFTKQDTPHDHWELGDVLGKLPKGSLPTGAPRLKT